MRQAGVPSHARRAEVENRVLLRIIEVVSSGTDLDNVLSATTELMLEAVDADACFVHLLVPSQGALVLRAASEPYRHLVGRIELDVGEGIAGWVAQHCEPVVIKENKWSDPRYKYIPELGGDRYTSMVSVPLLSPAGHLVGVVNIHTEQKRHFGPEQVAFLEHVGSLVAAAIEHAELFRRIAAKERELQGFIERTVQAQEEERRRVATEIHDGVTQQLISIWYRLSACERLLETDPKAAREELEAAKERVDEALEEARAAIYDLRPATLDDLGLAPALQTLVSRTLGSDVDVSVATDLQSEVPNHLETALYRIAQEALNNIRKHAGATSVDITLEAGPGPEVVMMVKDDGKGFDYDGYVKARPETSFGLAGMAERVDLIGGDLTVHSAPRQGTTIQVRVPLDRTRVGASHGH